MKQGICHQNKQNLKHDGHLREQPQPLRSLRRQTIQEFIEGRLIMNERGVATPTSAGNGSHISHHTLPPPHPTSATTTDHHHTSPSPHITTTTAHHHNATTPSSPPNNLITANTIHPHHQTIMNN